MKDDKLLHVVATVSVILFSSNNNNNIIIIIPRRHFLIESGKIAIINTRGTGEPPGPCPEFITMNQNILSQVPGGKVYNTNYRAALDQISEYGTDDVCFFFFFFFHNFFIISFFSLLPLSPLTTNPNIPSLSRSSPTSTQPSNPSPTNVLFSKATRKAPPQPLPPSPVSHYRHPRKKEKEMQMQSKRCFWWEIRPVSRGWNVMLIILVRGVRGIRGGFWGFWEKEGLRGSGWRRRGMFVFL